MSTSSSDDGRAPPPVDPKRGVGVSGLFARNVAAHKGKGRAEKAVEAGLEYVVCARCGGPRQGEERVCAFCGEPL